jgi:D-amino peptidase
MSKPRKIFVTIDMEGITGLVDWHQTGGDTPEYDHYRRLMAGDLNAVIEGALEAGVKDIVVSDAHGKMRNINPWEINEAATLIRGSPKPYRMMAGIDSDFDAALFVGYHAMRGTMNAILCHTYTLGVMSVSINGVQMGEFGLNASLAGYYGVPAVFISGDQAVAEEATNLVPKIHKAIVKRGMGRYSAQCLPPEKTGPLIKSVVTESLSNIKNIEPLVIESPIELRIELSTVNKADEASTLPYVERVDGRTLKAVFDNYPMAHRGFTGIISVASRTPDFR